MCRMCDVWKAEAERDPPPMAKPDDPSWTITLLTCPICDTQIIATTRTARVVKGAAEIGHWNDARERYAAGTL